MINKNDISLKTIEIPQESQEKAEKVAVIRKLVKTIKNQLQEVTLLQNQEVNEQNFQSIQETLIVVNSLIEDCHMAKEFNCSKNKKFIMLIYEFQRLSLKAETYKLNITMNELNKKTIGLKNQQKILEEQYKNAEEKNNNLVYNLLGFLTAFSIVSAVVGTIQEIKGTINLMLFMSFTAWILVTTLIGLHNFYKNNNRRNGKLQDNYFLWKVLTITIIGLFIIQRNTTNYE